MVFSQSIGAEVHRCVLCFLEETGQAAHPWFVINPSICARKHGDIKSNSHATLMSCMRSQNNRDNYTYKLYRLGRHRQDLQG